MTPRTVNSRGGGQEPQGLPDDAVVEIGTDPVGEAGVIEIGTDVIVGGGQESDSAVFLIGTDVVGKSADGPETFRSEDESD